MKVMTPLSVTLIGLLVAMSSALGQGVDLHWTSPVRERFVTFYAEPQGKPPEEMAVLVESDAPQMESRKRQLEWEAEVTTNRELMRTKRFPFMTTEGRPDFEKAVWVPFQTNLSVDLGSGDGSRWLWVSYRSKNDKDPYPQWNSHHIFVQTSPPIVVFTSPKERITSQPMIQLKGYVTSDLGHPLHYQVFNQKGEVTTSEDGSVNDRYLDPVTFQFTTNYFTCYDIALNPGTNTIVLQGEDEAGFSFTTNFAMVFTTDGDTNPPVFSIDSPEPGGEISDDSITIRGPSDDPTAKMVGLISANGHTNNISALIERNGYFWFEHVPLAEGANQVILVATDVSGNSSSTNFVIYGSNEVRIRMDPVQPADELWQPKIAAVTGKVQPANHDVWINGVQATVKPDGTWLAKNVPVVSSPSGGTALFDLTTLSPSDIAKGNIKIKEQTASQASLGTDLTPIAGHIISRVLPLV
ncbi:MAG TPA: hypothetical protein VMB80_13025 [Candidatus Acidoferrum sp.]|nr:hypothetical protein [Candidatus Acidoferrum sp.]